MTWPWPPTTRSATPIRTTPPTSCAAAKKPPCSAPKRARWQPPRRASHGGSAPGPRASAAPADAASTPWALAIPRQLGPHARPASPHPRRSTSKAAATGAAHHRARPPPLPARRSHAPGTRAPGTEANATPGPSSPPSRSCSLSSSAASASGSLIKPKPVKTPDPIQSERLERAAAQPARKSTRIMGSSGMQPGKPITSMDSSPVTVSAPACQGALYTTPRSGLCRHRLHRDERHWSSSEARGQLRPLGQPGRGAVPVRRQSQGVPADVGRQVEKLRRTRR